MAVASDGDAFVAGDPNCRVVNPQPEENEHITWTGTCKDGFADGTGVLQWYRGDEKRSTFEGELRRGLPNGQGVYQYSSKSRYEGEFKDGRREGKGVLISPDGTRLSATFVQGVAKGYVEQTFPNGAWYHGEWQNGKYEGKGKLQYADGSLYEGDFKAGLRDGMGSLTSKNGNHYEGGWSNGYYDGIGTLHYGTGAIYAGGWKQGRYDGKGRVTNADGSSNDVEYRGGVRIDLPTPKWNSGYAARVLRSTNAIAEYVGPYANAKEHKAFAQSPLGVWGSATDKASEDEAKASALAQCQNSAPDGDPPCLIVDLEGDFIKSATAEERRLTLEFAGKYVEAMLAAVESTDRKAYEQAAGRLSRLVRPSQFASRDAVNVYEKGAIKNNAGDYEAAIAPLKEAAEDSPGVAELQYSLAVAQINAGHLQEANSALTSALLVKMSDTKAWRAEARMWAKSGDLQRARQALLVGLEASANKHAAMEDYRTAAADEADDVLRKLYKEVLPAAEARFDAWHATIKAESPNGSKAQVQLSTDQAVAWKMIGNTCRQVEYPREAMRQRAQGNVVMALHIGERGEVQDAVMVLSTGNRELDEVTRNAVASCQFLLPSSGFDPYKWAVIEYRWQLKQPGSE
jgi:TonB family protein